MDSIYFVFGFLASFGAAIVLKTLLKTSQAKTPEDSNSDSDSESEEYSSDEDSDSLKMVIVVRQDLKMTKGKIASQCAHAAIACYQQAKRCAKRKLKLWQRNGSAKIVVKCQTQQQLEELYVQARNSRLTASLIRDAGRTQIEPGSTTVLGIGPAYQQELNDVTGHLKLL